MRGDAIKSRTSWEVDVDNAFYVNAEGDDYNKQFINGFTEQDWAEAWDDGDKFFSNYSSIQKAINRRYNTYAKGINKYDDTHMYVFILPEDKTRELGQLGDMPLGEQWGYLFVNNFGEAHYRTLSHELGHGRTALPHTFKDEHLSQGSTNNLMDYPSGDYPNGTDLVRAQWDMVHNPAIFTPLQSDGDGAAIDLDKLIIVVCSDTIRLNKEMFTEDLYEKNYNVLKGEKAIVSLFKKIKDGYEPFKVSNISIGSKFYADVATVTEPLNSERTIVIKVNKNTIKLKFAVADFQFLANAGDDNMPEEVFNVEEGSIFYGFNEIKVKLLSKTEGVDMNSIVDSIKCGENFIVGNIQDWNNLNISNWVENKTSIEIVPKFGSKRTIQIQYDETPVINLALKYKSGNNSMNLGIDHYNLLKSELYDTQNSKKQFYSEFVTGEFAPNILLTTNSPKENILFEFNTNKLSTIISENGIYHYKCRFGKSTSKTATITMQSDRRTFDINITQPDVFTYNSTFNDYVDTLYIEDAQNTIKGQIIFVKPVIEGELKEKEYTIVKIAYEGTEKTLDESKHTNAANDLAQLGISIGDYTKPITYNLEDSFIAGVYEFELDKRLRRVSKADMQKYLASGTSTKDQTDEFKQVLYHILMANKPKDVTETSNTIFVLPIKLYGVAGYATKYGQAIANKVCLPDGFNPKTLPHEIGHNLGLDHMKEEGISSENESNIKTNNIMGYQSDRHSFWVWQKIKAKIN